jgi:hypothetical protein
MMRSSLAAAGLTFAAFAIQPAFAQLLNTQASTSCHVVQAANLTHDRMLVTLTATPSGANLATNSPRVGGGWVEACTTAELPLPPTLRCDLDVHVLAEFKDASKVPPPILSINPAAAPTIALATGVVPNGTPAQPLRWFGIYYPRPGKADWLEMPPGTKL